MTTDNVQDKCLQVLFFDRTSGSKKCRTPFKTEKLSQAAADSLPMKFCKKDPKSGIQKQFKCLACSCQIEAVQALIQHLEGVKHLERLKSFVPRDTKPKIFLGDFIKDYDSYILGLDKVKEYTLPNTGNQNSLIISL